jgi:exopolyphosphatase/guanosine-5'-triphosphate,3'-diphosphate pyrophosphatase
VELRGRTSAHEDRLIESRHYNKPNTPINKHLRIASIDIGTNTLRLLVSEENEGTPLKKLYIGSEITRLGEGLHGKEKLINERAIGRSIRALSGFSSKIKEYDVGTLRAVATSAVRESLNGLDFVKTVEEETGITVDVITAKEEARLTVKGVLNSVKFDTPDCLIFDIGGGSTEYAYVEGGMISEISSTAIGVVHLTEQYLNNDIETEGDLATLGHNIDVLLNSSLSTFARLDVKNLTLIGTAGTPTTLAAIQMHLDRYNPSLVNNFILTRDMIESTLSRLIKIPRSERTNVPGLEKGREDLIISGAMIVIKTMDLFSSDTVVVSDAGLLEGVAYDFIERHKQHNRTELNNL